MPNSATLLQMLDQWALWLQMCINLPITAPACRPMWLWVMYFLFEIGVLTALWVIWKIISYKLQYAAAIRAQMERERVADEEVMVQYRYKEVADIEADVTDPHLAKKIRDELERQRLERMTGKPNTEV